MYPSSVNAPRLYAMIFGFFSLTAIFVVATASVNLTQDAGKMVYVAEAAELSAPLLDPTLGNGGGSDTVTAPKMAPLPTMVNTPQKVGDDSQQNPPNGGGMMPPRQGGPNGQQNNFNNQQGMNQQNDMMGQDNQDQTDQQDQPPEIDGAAIKDGIQAAKDGFDKFVGEFKNVGPFIIKYKAAKRVAGSVKQKDANDKLCPLIADLLTSATDLQTKLAAASADVADGYGSMADALNVATHVMALESITLEDSGDTVTIDTGAEETTTTSSCQAADDLRGTVKIMNGSIAPMTKFTAQAVREINNNKKILATLLKKTDQLDQMKDPSVMFQLFGKAEQSAQKVLNMTNDFLSRVINGLEQMN